MNNYLKIITFQGNVHYIIQLMNTMTNKKSFYVQLLKYKILIEIYRVVLIFLFLKNNYMSNLL